MSIYADANPEAECSRPDDFFEDDKFEEEDDNNNPSQSKKYPLIHGGKLSRIIEESKSEYSHRELLVDDDKETRQQLSKSIPSLKNMEKSADLLNISKSSMLNLEKSVKKSSATKVPEKERSLIKNNISSHSLKRTASKYDSENATAYVHDRSTASSKSKVLNNSRYDSNSIIIAGSVKSSSNAKRKLFVEATQVSENRENNLENATGFVHDRSTASSKSKPLNNSSRHNSNSSIIVGSFKSPPNIRKKMVVGSTPLPGKRGNNLENLSISTIRNDSIRSDISGESSINSEQINQALRHVNYESLSFLEKKVNTLSVRYPLKGIDGYLKKSFTEKNSFQKTNSSDFRGECLTRENKENKCSAKFQSIPVQNSVIQTALFTKNQHQNMKTNVIRNYDNGNQPSNILIAIRPDPISHFGFVALNDSLTKSIFVYNPSNEKLQIRPHLKSKWFTLLSNSVILLPKEEYSFQVQFSPVSKATFKGKIGFEVCGKIFYHELIGFGGAANCILTNSKLKQLSNLQYCLKPQDPSSFLLKLKNIGNRTAFIHLVAVDNRGEIIEGIKFNQQKFCLNYDQNDCERNINITVPEHVISTIEERLSICSQSSAGSSTKNPNEKYLFDIKIYWGDEKLRERAKKFILSMNGEHPIIGHIYCTRDSYTENNDIEVQQLEATSLTIQDVEMLKAQTRIVTTKICDDRVNASRPTSRQQYRCESQVKGLPPDYYVPSIADDSMNETLTSVYSIGNRTLLPKSLKLINKK